MILNIIKVGLTDTAKMPIKAHFFRTQFMSFFQCMSLSQFCRYYFRFFIFIFCDQPLTINRHSWNKVHFLSDTICVCFFNVCHFLSFVGTISDIYIFFFLTNPLTINRRSWNKAHFFLAQFVSFFSMYVPS